VGYKIDRKVTMSTFALYLAKYVFPIKENYTQERGAINHLALEVT
jgi:hypothetical protein